MKTDQELRQELGGVDVLVDKDHVAWIDGSGKLQVVKNDTEK